MSQNLDIGLSFCFMGCRSRDYKFNGKSYPFLGMKSKLEPKHKI